MVIESLHNRVHELEMELNDLRQIAESTTTVSRRAIYLCQNLEWIAECQNKHLNGIVTEGQGDLDGTGKERCPET